MLLSPLRLFGVLLLFTFFFGVVLSVSPLWTCFSPASLERCCLHLSDLCVVLLPFLLRFGVVVLSLLSRFRLEVGGAFPRVPLLGGAFPPVPLRADLLFYLFL